MYISLRRLSGALGIAVVLGALPLTSIAQQAGALPAANLRVELSQDTVPDAPTPQFSVAAADQPDDQAQPAQTNGVPAPTPANPQESTSSQSQQPAAGEAQKPTSDEQRQKAQDQLKQQEHQRVMGVMATFNTTANRNALPLSPGQKFQLFFRSEIDPWPFALSVVVAGIGQANDSTPEWGQGAQGYAKRFGAAYSDAFIGNFFGNAVLPTVLKEDPRYFQKGTGSFASRALWAAGSTVWCKRDKGTWGPNYANVGGNMIGSAISTLYKPASERSVGDVIEDGLTVSAEGIVGAEVIEFWPDLVRHHNRKKAEKLAREQAQKDAQSAAQPKNPSPPAAKPDKPQD